MDFYFFDSSATVKNYVSETGTNRVKTIFAGIPQNDILMASILTFVSADVELNVAAQNEGLTVENPNNHP